MLDLDKLRALLVELRNARDMGLSDCEQRILREIFRLAGINP